MHRKCCCLLPCQYCPYGCIDNQLEYSIKVTFSGVVNFNCSDCDVWNDSFIVTRHDPVTNCNPTGGVLGQVTEFRWGCCLAYELPEPPCNLNWITFRVWYSQSQGYRITVSVMHSHIGPVGPNIWPYAPVFNYATFATVWQGAKFDLCGFWGVIPFSVQDQNDCDFSGASCVIETP